MAKKKNTVEGRRSRPSTSRTAVLSLPLRDDGFGSRHGGAKSRTPSASRRRPRRPRDPDTAKKHLRGLVEALVFASDQPIKPNELGKLAEAPSRQIKELLDELKVDYAGRGIQLDEVAGGYAFRTNVAFAPFVRDLVGQKPVRLTRAQVETLAIVAYRQPITRPDIDDVRGVDCGPVLRTLLERDLVRILGKQDEPPAARSSTERPPDSSSSSGSSR